MNSHKTYNLTFIDQCNCLLDKSYIWDEILKKCVRNCTNDKTGNHLNGLDIFDTSFSKCLCDPSTLEYDPLSNSCLSLCKSDPNAHVKDTAGNCECNSGFSLVNNVCTKDCPTLEGYAGNDGADKCLCDTANGFKLVTEAGPYQSECVLDCSKVANSAGTNTDRISCDPIDDTYKFNA